MMKCIVPLILLLFILNGCIEQKDTLTEQPKIELLSPSPCDTLYFGESFHYTARITDNTGLGNISMDVHHNFGHHNHGEHESCPMDAVKDPVDPFAESWIYSLPTEKTEYVFDTIINLPAQKNASTVYDPGDYHFHIYVTDNDGYQSFSTLDVKILNR